MPAVTALLIPACSRRKQTADLPPDAGQMKVPPPAAQQTAQMQQHPAERLLRQLHL
jgi:hypothetical protein